MQNPFRRAETPPDAPDRHQATLDLIEEVAMLRGHVRSMQVEWDDIRVQIKKGYQRLEKAAERLDKGREKVEEKLQEADEPAPGQSTFLHKLANMKRG